MSPAEALAAIAALPADVNPDGSAYLHAADVAEILDAVSVDATPAQGIDRDALRDVLWSVRPVGASEQWAERATDAVLALVRPVEGVVISPEDCSRLMGAVVRGGFRTEDPADQALAAHLEAAS